MSMVTVPSVLPESILMADAIQRKFQGHTRPNVYVGGRSGRYDYGLGHAFPLHNIVERRSAYGYGLAGLGQTCDGTGNCYDDSGNFIGTMDPSGTQPFVPVSGYSGPLPIIAVAAGTPGAATGGGGVMGPQPTAASLGINPSDPNYQAELAVLNSGALSTTPGSTVQTASGQQVQVPSGMSQAQQLAFWTNLVNQGFSLAKLSVIQPGTSQSGGNITRQAPGYPVQPLATSTSLTTSLGLTGASSSGFMLLAVLGLVLVLGMNKGQGGGRQ